MWIVLNLLLIWSQRLPVHCPWNFYSLNLICYKKAQWQIYSYYCFRFTIHNILIDHFINTDSLFLCLPQSSISIYKIIHLQNQMSMQTDRSKWSLLQLYCHMSLYLTRVCSFWIVLVSQITGKLGPDVFDLTLDCSHLQLTKAAAG